ncbi:MAG: FAD-dependent oxidoreductase [Candidatus Latescibacteria bacterium]|nr:FAD-dependent oxidoreductase [Candidatus Latescibacterota bacterium]
MECIVEPERETPISHRVDAVIVGGGPGGFPAAVAAARNGANTLLVEQYGFLGGMATAGLVNPFMSFHAGEEQIIEGIFQELRERLEALGGGSGCGDPRSFNAEVFKIAAEQMCLEAGVKLLYHTIFVDSHVTGDRIDGIIVENKSGRTAIMAQVVVDATGDADVAARAGVPVEIGRPEDGATQPMTLFFYVADVDTEKMENYFCDHPEDRGFLSFVEEATRNGDLQLKRENILLFKLPQKGQIAVNSTRIVGVDGTRAEELTRAEIEGRKQVMMLMRFFRKYLPGFQQSYLLAIAPQVGVRETRRIVGEYVMTAEDVLQGKKFNDVIARGAYGIDIHNPKGKGSTVRYLKPGTSYDIPYRCLVPLEIENLLVAGRPISATHEAHSAIRIMPQCMAIGQAAGTAAALALQTGVPPRKVGIAQLQTALISQGANLGRGR